MKKVWVVIAVLLLVPSIAQDEKEATIIVNSRNWQDVYSGMQFGYLEDEKPAFMVSERHGSLILNDYTKEQVRVKIFSSESDPWVVGLRSIAESRDFETEETLFDNMNLELAEQVSTNKFIIVDDAYGYNALSVAPFAVRAEYYTLFADAQNIDDVIDFLNSRPVENVLVYGHVDREVRNAVAPFDPEIINENGDRYANNIEIVKRYQEIANSQQVILNNGEFIEAQIMSGNEPVVFIGKGAIPSVVEEYITNSDVRVGILIGNELVRTATQIRRQLGISVFVKYARSARSPSGPVSQVEGLDRFILPQYELNLQIERVRYNTVSNQLEIVLQNGAEVATYFRGTYTIVSSGDSQTVGDTDALFVDANRPRTIVYEMDPIANTDNMVAQVFIVYGESENALERILEGEFPIEVVDVVDDAEITIESVEFWVKKQEFVVNLRNVGAVTAYAETEALNVRVLDETQNYGSEEVIEIKAGKTAESVIPTDITEDDLDRNKKIKIRAYYGENEALLSKIIEGEFEYELRRFDVVSYAPTLIIVLLVLLILTTIGKKRCHSCRKKVSKRAKFCKKCGHHF